MYRAGLSPYGRWLRHSEWIPAAAHSDLPPKEERQIASQFLRPLEKDWIEGRYHKSEYAVRRAIVTRRGTVADRERRNDVGQERRIEDLIQLGLQFLGHELDQHAFEDWRGQATDCLRAEFGADHTYSKYFCEYVRAPQDMDLLAAKGILAAAKEMIANKRNCSHESVTACRSQNM